MSKLLSDTIDLLRQQADSLDEMQRALAQVKLIEEMCEKLAPPPPPRADTLAAVEEAIGAPLPF